MKRLLMVSLLVLVSGKETFAPMYSEFEKASERTTIQDKQTELKTQRERDIKIAEEAIRKQEEATGRLEGEERKRADEELVQSRQRLQSIRDTTVRDLKSLEQIGTEDFSRERTKRLDEVVKSVEETTSALSELNNKLKDQFLATQPPTETVIRSISGWDALVTRMKRFSAKIERAFKSLVGNKEAVASLDRRIENLSNRLKGIASKSGYRNLEVISEALDEARGSVTDSNALANVVTNAALAVQETAKSGASPADVQAARDAANLLAVEADGIIDVDPNGQVSINDASQAQITAQRQNIDALIRQSEQLGDLPQ